MLGLDPGPLTLRELCAMAEARQRAEWGRTSHVLAMLANTRQMGKRSRVFAPRDFDPYARRSGRRRLTARGVAEVLGALAKQHEGKGSP